MATSKAIQLYLQDGNLNGILTIQEPAGWGAGILVSAPRENFGKLLQREEINYAGIYFLLSDDRVYVGQSQSSIKTRLNQHDKNKDWWDRVLFLTKTDNSLSATAVQYMEVKFIEKAKEAGTADVDNKNGGNMGGNISEFDRAANDQFMNEAVLLFEVIGIDVFQSKKKKRKKKIQIPTENKTYTPATQSLSKTHRKWCPQIAELVFHYKTQNGGNARVQWQSENEIVLLRGSMIGNTTTNNAAGDRVKSFRKGYTTKLTDYEVNSDIIFSSLNRVVSFVIGGAANAYVVLKSDSGETLDEVLQRLNS